MQVLLLKKLYFTPDGWRLGVCCRISCITWFTAALLSVPIRFSRAAGLLAARPVITPWPRRRPSSGGTLLFLNLDGPPRGTPPPDKWYISYITLIFLHREMQTIKHTPLWTCPAVLGDTPFPWVKRPFFLTGLRFTVACLLFNCCSFLFNRMMSSVKFITRAMIKTCVWVQMRKLHLAS